MEFLLAASPLEPIVRVLEQVIATINGVTHNFGWTMVIFAGLVTLALWPLRHMQYKSMAEMQVLQPHVKELQKRYKDNREELGKAQMALFKEHGVNPAAGCFPLLIQMPILFSLYYAITSTLVPIDPAVHAVLTTAVTKTAAIAGVDSSAGLHKGQTVTLDSGTPNAETVVLSAVNTDKATSKITISAVFTKEHRIGAAVTNKTSDVTNAAIEAGKQTTITGVHQNSQPTRVGDQLVVDSGANQEFVIVTSVGGNAWTARFEKSHAAGVPYSNRIFAGAFDAQVLPGTATVKPGALAGTIPQPTGRVYISDGANSELVTVDSSASDSFTADFSKPHPAGTKLAADDQAKFASERWLWIGSKLSQHYPKVLATLLAAPDMVLLALYVISMYFTVRYSSPATDPAMQQQQQMMAIVSPLMIAFVGRRWPSALILYWFLSNALSTGQQFYLLNRIKRKIVVPPLPSATPGFNKKEPKNVTPVNGANTNARKKRTRR